MRGLLMAVLLAPGESGLYRPKIQLYPPYAFPSLSPIKQEKDRNRGSYLPLLKCMLIRFTLNFF